MLQTMPPKARDQSQHKTTTPPRSNQALQRESGVNKAADDANSETDLSTQSRILRLRRARFRGVPISSTEERTPPTSSHSAQRSPRSTPEHLASSLLDDHNARSSLVEDRAPESCGVLQEISNSSLRRRTHGSRSRTSPPRPSSRGSDKRSSRYSPTRSSASRHPAIAPDTFHAPGLEYESPLAASPPTKLVTKRSRYSRSTPSRRGHMDNEALGYIEHLESQLAALSTQVQALTSPSTSKAQSAKLRALNSESNLLRQEVSDWETKFSERIREQTEQHEVVVGTLKAQLRTLERDSESMRGRLQMLEIENEEKKTKTIALTNANQDLERRLLFLSELLAASPTKLELCSPGPFEARHRPQSRPRSLVLPLMSTLNSGSSPPKIASNGTPAAQQTDIGDRVSVRPKTAEWRQSMPAGRTSPRVNSQDSTDDEGDVTEGVLPEDLSISPTHRRLTMQGWKTENDLKRRSTRVMRRFYGGAHGPRTLILPATSQSSAYAIPASNSVQPAVTIDPQALVESSSAASDPLQSSTTAWQHRRAATWDEDDALVSQSRRSGSLTLTPTKARQALVTAMEAHHPPASALDDWADELGSRSPGNRDSLGSIEGLNLFDELKTFEALESHSRRIASTSTMEEASGSRRTPPDLEERKLKLVDGPTSRDRYSNSPGTLARGHSSTTSTTTTRSSPQPLRLMGALAAAVSRTLERRATGARSILSNAWDIVTLSRPVLEFRWWLIKILLGDLKKKSSLWPPPLNTTIHPHQSSLGLSTLPDLGMNSTKSDKGAMEQNHDRVLLECLTHVQRSKARDRRVLQAPAVHWLKFGVTLLFAVGIALKNGPSSVLGESIDANGSREPRQHEADDERKTS